MFKRCFIMIAGLCPALTLPAQSTIDSVLSRILANNKSFKAEEQRLTAANTGFRTGISLYDPVVQYDYMKGSPASAGNQNDISVTQPFDFPTVYSWRNKVASLQTAQTGFEKEILRKQILMDAKVICLELVYLNKRKRELSQRLWAAQIFYDNYQKKFEKQDATILDLNKAKLRLTNIRSDVALLDSEISQNVTMLIGLNGGMEISFQDTLYPAIPILPPFDALEKQIEATDPMRMYLEGQKQVGDAQVKLNRSLGLPKLEIGYHYQGILGQTYQGAHVGVSIPLWENKNKVQYQQLQSAYYELELQEHRNEHYYEIKLAYEKYQTLKANFDEYAAQLQSLLQSDLLNKALQAGQMTTLEYYMELTLYYESLDRYLLLEKEFQVALGELLIYRI